MASNEQKIRQIARIGRKKLIKIANRWTDEEREFTIKLANDVHTPGTITDADVVRFRGIVNG